MKSTTRRVSTSQNIKRETFNSFGDYASNLVEEDKRDTKSRQTEFRRLQEKLDAGVGFI